MNGFQKRVALLEKWAPNLLPKLKDIDDMAEIILDVWDVAQAHTEERIVKLINDRKESIQDADGLITAMRIPVDKEAAIAITEAIIYAIKEDENE